MKYDFNPLPVAVPNDKPNNRSILQAKFSLDQLSGAGNKKSVDRAVRVGELLATGKFKVDSSGLIVPAQYDEEPVKSPGRNLLINGGLRVWQRGVSFNADGYCADRWRINHASATFTLTRVVLPGEGFTSVAAMQVAITNLGGGINIRQPIEDVNTASGKKCVLSFKAKASAAGMVVSAIGIQAFGSGGSASVTIPGGQVVLGTTVGEHSVVIDVPSVAGKVVGGNSSLQIIIGFHNAGVYSLGDLQFEVGGVATPFEFRSAPLDLTECKRYYHSSEPLAAAGNYNDVCQLIIPSAGAPNRAVGNFHFPLPMRTKPALRTYNPNDGSYSTVHFAGSANVPYASIEWSRNGITQFNFATNYTAGHVMLVRVEADAEL